MGKLTKDEEKSLLYFAGIKAMTEKTIGNNVIFNRNLRLEEENEVFATYFFLVTMISGASKDVRDKVLNHKEYELRKEKMINARRFEKYVDLFNNNIKDISKNYLKVHDMNIADDKEFQDTLLENFVEKFISDLKVDDTQNTKNELNNLMLRAIEIGSTY